jgi:hypothetical protein
MAVSVFCTVQFHKQCGRNLVRDTTDWFHIPDGLHHVCYVCFMWSFGHLVIFDFGNAVIAHYI